MRAGPLAPRWLKVEHATSNSVGVSWAGPARSASALGGFAVRYRTRAEPRWAALELLPPGAAAADITNMTHGEHYIIRLDAVSEDADGETVESEPPVTTEHTVRECPAPTAPHPHTRHVPLLMLAICLPPRVRGLLVIIPVRVSFETVQHRHRNSFRRISACSRRERGPRAARPGALPPYTLYAECPACYTRPSNEVFLLII